MKIKSKTHICLAFYLLLVQSTTFAQNIKPMAPSIGLDGNNLSGKEAETLLKENNNDSKANQFNIPLLQFQNLKNTGNTDIYESLDTDESKNNLIIEIENQIMETQDDIAQLEKILKEKGNIASLTTSTISEENPNILIETNTPEENSNILIETNTSSITNTPKEIQTNKKEELEKIQNTQCKLVSKHTLSIKEEAKQIEEEIRQEENITLKNLRVLWQGAIEKSTTIRLAIQKLSNPNASEKIDQNVFQKIISPIASMAPLAAMSSVSPTQTASALIGGGMLGSLASNEAAEYNKQFLRVSDYDLIMLAKEVDELQSELLISYYEYKDMFYMLNLSEEALKKAYDYYLKAEENNNIPSLTAADAFYREAIQTQRKFKQKFLSARARLEQITGNNAIVYIESLKPSDYEEKENSEQALNTEENNNTTN